MTGFNQFYYSFSPAVADYERENPAFKEAVKIALTPLLTSLTLLQYADIDSESEMLGYGIGIILLNIGMYFVAPAFIILLHREYRSETEIIKYHSYSMHTVDTIMKDMVNLRIHIAPVAFEVDRIVISAVRMKADKVWLIAHDNVAEDKSIKYRQKIEKELEKKRNQDRGYLCQQAETFSYHQGCHGDNFQGEKKRYLR